MRPGSALDREALKRGNSVYFPDRVVPMLPERISNDLCSLREGEDRPALAVRMAFSADGRKIEAHLPPHHDAQPTPSCPTSRRRRRSTARADDKAPDRCSTPSCSRSGTAYATLKRGREAREPLELDLPERKMLLKPDGTVDRVVVPERLDAHKLIEEFMIQANVAAAETLERKQAGAGLPHPRRALAGQAGIAARIPQVARTCRWRAARICGRRSSTASWRRCHGADHEELVNEVVLRSQSQAEYAPDNIGHFGLNLLRYAHFTSPIRRYADLIVHRALVTALKLGEGGISPEQEAMLEVIATDISVAERRAMQAERETIDRLVAGFLSEKIGEVFRGRINGVTKAGLFVTLEDTGADGFVPISMIGDEYFRYDQDQHSVTGEATGLTYQMGQKVEVRLVEAAPIAGALRFEITSGGVTGGRPMRSRPANQKRGTRAGPGGGFPQNRGRRR